MDFRQIYKNPVNKKLPNSDGSHKEMFFLLILELGGYLPTP